MPITVRHGPDLRLVGAGGLLAGYGDFQKQQAEFELKQRIAAQNAANDRAQIAEAQRRTNAGIFGDQQRLGAQMFENRAQRQHQFDLGEDRFMQQAALAEFGLEKQQVLQQQQAMSQQQLAEQKAAEQYQTEVNKSLQEFDWAPEQKREQSKINEARMRLKSRSDLDPEQVSSGLSQLDQRERSVVGTPRQRKENPIKLFPAVNGITGEPMTDSRGNPLQGYSNGSRTDIYEDPWISATAKAEADERAAARQAEIDERRAQRELENDQRSAELDRQKQEIAAKKDALKAQMSVIADASKALIVEEKNRMGDTVGKKLPDPQQLIQYLQTIQTVGQAIGMAVDQAPQAGAAVQPAQAQPGFSAVNDPTQMTPQQNAAFVEDQFQTGAPMGQQPAQQQAPQQPPVFSARLKRNVTMAEIEATAQARGISPTEVMKRLGIQ
jgi:hypothetical protein